MLPLDVVTHKPTRECPQVQPHPKEQCGIVRARREHQQRGDAAVKKIYGSNAEHTEQ